MTLLCLQHVILQEAAKLCRIRQPMGCD